MKNSYVSDLRQEFRGYNGAKFAKDLMAGVTVAAVALPLALAFGVSSGATAASGLLDCCHLRLCHQSVGRRLLSDFRSHRSHGRGAHVHCGPVRPVRRLYGHCDGRIILVLAGILHLGKVTAFIPMPVITGFTSGISVVIALGQLDNFSAPRPGLYGCGKGPQLFYRGLFGQSGGGAAGQRHHRVMIVYPKKWNAVVPASLVSIILATAASLIIPMDIQRVGEIPSSLLLPERFTLDGLDLATVRGLLAPAVSIAALGMIESLLCGASAARMTGVRLNSDRELIAQGVGNILSPLFGGIPATAAIARTSVAIKSGAQTRLTGMIHALVLLVSLLVLGPVMAQIPLSALAGVLLVTAWRMNEWHTIQYIFSHKFKGAMVKFLATMIATIVFDLTIAILIGVVAALVLLAVRQSHLEIHFDDVKPQRLQHPEDLVADRFENAEVVYLTGAVLFANCEQITDLAGRFQGRSAVLFSMRGVSYMDVSGAQAFLELLRQLKEQELPVYICGLSDSVRLMMERSGIVELLGEDHFYWSVERALHA